MNLQFKNWLEYFRSNQYHFDHVDMESGYEISNEEKEVITKSIKQFQKGENSEGKNLFKYAREYGDPDYLEAIKYFIREEQTHARVLAKFMEWNGIVKMKSHWVDNIFRSLRNLAGLENSVMVLITAEIIAAVYYQALAKATNSNLLKRLCYQILEDEEMHINFQSYTLSEHYMKRNILGRWFVRSYHRILMTGTIFVVWAFHRNVMIKGGFTFWSFFVSVIDEFDRSERMVTGVESVKCNIRAISLETANGLVG